MSVKQNSAPTREKTTRENILRAATRVFARYGYEGGSIEKISRSAKSVDRMIYYYFDSKEGLFIEVLENAYRRMNDAELKLKLDTSKPIDGLNDVIAFVLSYYRKNPEFITLLNTENLQRGKHISKSDRARDYSSPAIAIVSELLQNGVAQGIFRADVSARNVYLLIAATAYFYMLLSKTLVSCCRGTLTSRFLPRTPSSSTTASLLRWVRPKTATTAMRRR